MNRWRCGLFLWVLFFLSSSSLLAGQPCHGLDRILYDAQVLLNEGDAKGAREILEKHTDRDTTCPVAWMLLGISCFQLEAFDCATAGFAAVVAAEPENGGGWRNLGWSHYQRGAYENAGQTFTRAATITGEAADRYRAGLSYYQAGAYQASAAQLSPLLELKDRKAEWVRLFAHANIALETPVSAIAPMRAYLSDHPEDAADWELLGRLYYDAGQLRQAAAVLEIAFGMNPPPFSRWKELSGLYQAIGLHRAAARCLLLADDAPLLAKARLLFAGGDGIGALALLGNHPGPDPAFRRLAGRIRMEMGDFTGALADFAAAGEDAGAFYLSAICLWEMGEYRKAVGFLDKAAADPAFSLGAKSLKTLFMTLIAAEKQADAG